ncbi:hypothetical protein SynRS9907_01306 [Synechococcus sp. RS9907]|nr:hypothetical protein SynRS9907_01306 [Synechococcus sp. RS9907]
MAVADVEAAPKTLMVDLDDEEWLRRKRDGLDLILQIFKTWLKPRNSI